MKYAADMLCRTFNKKYNTGQWVDLRNGQYGELAGNAHTFNKEARVKIIIDGEEKYINSASVEKVQEVVI